jgi:hypothetical protein
MRVCLPCHPNDNPHRAVNSGVHMQITFATKVLCLAVRLREERFSLRLRPGDEFFVLRPPFAAASLVGFTLEISRLFPRLYLNHLGLSASSGDPTVHFRFSLPNLIQGREFGFSHP